MAYDPARASMLARAFHYPYAPPSHPLLFTQGRAAPWAHRGVRHDGRMVEVAGLGLCAPILAVGSNASLAVLRRKFGVRPVQIVQGAVLVRGFARLHSAHIARYGSMPATLAEQPDAFMNVHLQLVQVQHLAALDISEAVGTNYDRVWLPMRLRVSWLRLSLEGVWAYVSRHGHARRNGLPMVLGPQRQALMHAADRARWVDGLPGFVERLVRDAEYRARVTQALKG